MINILSKQFHIPTLEWKFGGEINGDERQHIRKTADLRIKTSTQKKTNLNVRQTIFIGII